MPKYVIEREIRGRKIVASRTQRHCAEIMGVLSKMGPRFMAPQLLTR